MIDDRVLNLLIKRMDDHKNESNRRFDEIQKDIHEINDKVEMLTSWRLRIGAFGIVAGIIAAFVWDLFKIGFEKMK